MALVSVEIAGVGAFAPQQRLTNQDLEKRLETTEDWIVKRTGIRERRVAPPQMSASDLATEAGRLALENAGVSAEEVELIVLATSTPDMWMPSTACIVQNALGARKAAAFDMGAACAGFSYAATVAAQFVRTGMYRTVLVIGVDLMSRTVDPQDRSTCILFGDGAGAMVLRQSTEQRLFYAHLGADGSGAELLYIPAGGFRLPVTPAVFDQGLQFMRMNGSEVFRFGVTALVSSVQRALADCGLGKDDIALLVPHQANARMIQAAADRLGLPLERFCVNVDRYGNTGAGSIPLALFEAVQQGRLAPGQTVALIGFGSGLAWGITLMTWAGGAKPA